MQSLKKNSVVSVVRYFILIVKKVKQRSECSQRFPFGSSEVKQRSERSQIFYFNSSEVKQRSERCQIYDSSLTYDREIISQ